MNTTSLFDGSAVPSLGLGTWKLSGAEVVGAVETAIQIGYRHLDCAHIYGNEAEIGQVLTRSAEKNGLDRSQLWITSKLWNDCHRPEHVRPALELTLKHLGLEYLDLYLMHWPIAHRHGVAQPVAVEEFESLADVPLAATWQAMEDCVRAGLCRTIGVSNHNIRKLQELLASASIPPAMNQVELHPLLAQNELLEFCQANRIAVTAYSPLGSTDRPERLRKSDEPPLLENQVVLDIAAKHRATAAQILLAWALKRGTIPIPKSARADRLAENFNAQQIELAEADIESLAGLDRGYRFIDGAFWSRLGGPYTTEFLWS